MNIINILSLSGLVFLSACSQHNSQNAAPAESTKKAAIAVDNIDKFDRTKADTGKASSEVEVEIPTTVTEAKIECKSKTLSYPDELIQQVKDAQKHCKKAVVVDMKDVVTIVDLMGMISQNIFMNLTRLGVLKMVCLESMVEISW